MTGSSFMYVYVHPKKNPKGSILNFLPIENSTINIKTKVNKVHAKARSKRNMLNFI